MTQEALAATLRHLALDGLDDFYRGDVGREIAADLDQHRQPGHARGFGPLRSRRSAEPLRSNLPAGTVYNTDAPTQGVASLMILALFARLRVTEAESFDHIHGLVEATKRALRTRDRVAHRSQPSRAPARSLPGAAFHRRRSDEDRPAQGGALAVRVGRRRYRVDGRRRYQRPRRVLHPIAVLGVRLRLRAAAHRRLMQNRGASFSLQRGALNLVAPGRLPIHTLNPALAVLKDGRIMAYGAMGGDGQPQTQAAVFTRHVTFGEPLDAAIDRPRWLLGPDLGRRARAAAAGIALRRQSRRSACRRRPRCRSSVRTLFRHDGPCRRGGAASGRHLRRRSRSARRWRRRGGVSINVAHVSALLAWEMCARVRDRLSARR